MSSETVRSSRLGIFIAFQNKRGIRRTEGRLCTASNIRPKLQIVLMRNLMGGGDLSVSILPLEKVSSFILRQAFNNHICLFLLTISCVEKLFVSTKALLLMLIICMVFIFSVHPPLWHEALLVGQRPEQDLWIHGALSGEINHHPDSDQYLIFSENTIQKHHHNMIWRCLILSFM